MLMPRLPLLCLVAVSLTLVGCGTPRNTYVPDGRRGFVVACGGLFGSYSSCLVKAGRACGNHGYDTIRGSEEDRTLLIACKVPPIVPTVPAPPPHA